MQSKTEIISDCSDLPLQEGGQSLLRGAFALTLCNVISQAINYGLHIGIGRFLSLGLYGYYGILVSTFSILEVILRWGISKAVAFHVARDKGQSKQTLKRCLRMQAVYALVCFLVFYSLTDHLAAILGDQQISSYFCAGAFFIFTFAFLPIYGGFLNGVGAFGKQGVLVVIRSLVNLLCITSLLVGYGIGMYSVIIGYMASTLAATLYGFWNSRPAYESVNAPVRTKNIIAFGFPLFVASLAGSLLMRMDLFMVQSLFGNRMLTGLYASASAIIKAPYFLSLGTGLVLFRSIVQLRKNPDEVRRFISKTFYYYIVGLAPIPFILCASAEQVLNFTFGANYLPATPVLKILSFCFTFMVLQDVLSTIIAGLGNPGFSMGLSLVLLPTQLFLIYTASLTGDLTGIALATTISWTLGLIAVAFYVVQKRYLSFPTWKTLLNVGIGSAGSYVVVSWISPSGFWLLPVCLLSYLLYVTLIRFMGELADPEAEIWFRRFGLVRAEGSQNLQQISHRM